MEERSGADPTGKGRDYHEALKLARQTSMRSITRLIELRESADEQIATVASKALGKSRGVGPRISIPRSQDRRWRAPAPLRPVAIHDRGARAAHGRGDADSQEAGAVAAEGGWGDDRVSVGGTVRRVGSTPPGARAGDD